jgi:hypothetical protein
MKRILVLLALAVSTTVHAQNLVKNGDFQQIVKFWDFRGCEPFIGGEYADMVNSNSAWFFESPHFNGVSPTNVLALMNNCAEQKVCFVRGLDYTMTYKYQRRTFDNALQNAEVPNPSTMNVFVLGYPSFTFYASKSVSASNQTWVPSWYSDLINFSIPASSTDTAIAIVFKQASIAVPPAFLGHGLVLDDVVVLANPTLDVNGPSVASVNSGTNWNIPSLAASTGATYNWSFPGATPATSTSNNPTNVQWPTQGVKTVTCTIGNGSCNLVTLVKQINITSALPVDLVAFSATEKSGAVELQWQTANEINTQYYGVYKSKDGINFTEVGKINAKNLLTGATYKFTDAQPGAAMVYYRLKPVDKNGTFKTTGIVKLRIGKVYLDVNVYPTVITSVLDYAVETPRAGKMMVYINDMSGRNIFTKAEVFNVGANKRNVDATLLAKGAYLLTIKDGAGFSKTIKFTKN